ncbi:uncharacterized protein BKA78DRAFT_141625 [Phyllosticta capitalensis]|uniref:uncharacterized protein n=1 Tax=Phyllosticta capitalensis TaxID=121624 RepID=UPI003130DDCA
MTARRDGQNMSRKLVFVEKRKRLQKSAGLPACIHASIRPAQAAHDKPPTGNDFPLQVRIPVLEHGLCACTGRSTPRHVKKREACQRSRNAKVTTVVQPEKVDHLDDAMCDASRKKTGSSGGGVSYISQTSDIDQDQCIGNNRRARSWLACSMPPTATTRTTLLKLAAPGCRPSSPTTITCDLHGDASRRQVPVTCG